MSRPPLDSTPIGMNTTNGTISQLDSIPIEKKHQNPCHEHNQQICQHNQHNCQSKKERRMYQRTRIQTHHRQTHHRANLIRPMIEISAKLESRTTLIWLMITIKENSK